ncbi:MAG: hypothetical protein NTY07_00445 [Bacteroidia bacterium]|nr:hypothetical protein [Bacteroidia bacterium]
MIKSGYVGFLIFVSMMIVFFVLPDPEGLQKPFRILIGLSFVIIYFALLIKKDIGRKTLWPVVIGGLFVVLMILRGTIQTSFINAYLCLFGLLCIPHLFFRLTPIRKTNLNYIHVLCILSILIQFLIYSSDDGRPSLAYQINLSGAYLFLFFISSDVLNNKHGKLLVIALSLLTLSRLLIFSMILFYLVRFSKKYFKSRLQKLNVTLIIISSYIVITFFSLWYVANVKSAIAYDTSINRVATLNDGSNELRFIANTLVIATIYTAPFDAKVLFGFGPVENFLNVTKGSFVMPHNELFDSIVQFGIITVIFFSLFSLPIFNKVTSYANIEFLIPILFHTLILWVRFLLVPSFEMLFILFLLYIVHERKQEAIVNS